MPIASSAASNHLEASTLKAPTSLSTLSFTLAAVFTPYIVQVIDTTKFSNPDPSGITWVPGITPGTGRLIVVNYQS